MFFYLQIAPSTYTTVLTLFTLEYLRYLQNNIFTTVLTNMILKLLTKQFLHYLQCSDYTTTDKVTAPIFVILLSLKYTADQNIWLDNLVNRHL